MIHQKAIVYGVLAFIGLYTAHLLIVPFFAGLLGKGGAILGLLSQLLGIAAFDPGLSGRSSSGRTRLYPWLYRRRFGHPGLSLSGIRCVCVCRERVLSWDPLTISVAAKQHAIGFRGHARRKPKLVQDAMRQHKNLISLQANETVLR